MRLVSPYGSFIGASVSGSVDATYKASWLTDGLPATPVRKTGGSISLGATASARNIDVLAVTHHRIKQAASISITGSVTTTIPTSAWNEDDIPYNWFRILGAPVSTTNLSIAVTGNTDPVIIGEMYAGLSFTLPDFLNRRAFEPGEPFEWEGELAGLAPYDPGLSEPRRESGLLILTNAQFAQLKSCVTGARRGTLPVLYIPDDNVNDAWLAQLRYTEQHEEGFHFVTLDIVEIPRTRW